MKKQSLCLLIFCLQFVCISNLVSKIWEVGGISKYNYCSDVENLVDDGDTILIAENTYTNDRQVTWRKNNLLIRGSGLKTNLVAGELIANDMSNGKGIFVIKGNNTTVENITFSQAKVKSGNGAGIRLEGANLIVRNCRFFTNEMGILAGGTIPNCKVLVEFCEFNNNGNSENPGYQHNIYINYIDTLIFRFNLSLNAVASGHEFKSRAYNNFIMYNRISNTNSVDSRNIDLPNGGNAIIVGNIIEQGENSENSNIIGYGLEGLKNPPPHNLWIANNTIINNKTKGSFVNIANGTDTLMLYNNVMVGAKTGGLIIGDAKFLDSLSNFINNDVNSPSLKDVKNLDFTPIVGSPLIDKATTIRDKEGKLKTIAGFELNPKYEYTAPSESIEVGIKARQYGGNNKLDIGAFEYENTNSVQRKNKDRGIDIYPNPATDELNISITTGVQGAMKLELVSTEGRVIYSYTWQQSTSSKELQISTRAIPSGLYQLRLITPLDAVTKNVVVVE